MAESKISTNLAMIDLEERINRAAPYMNNPCGKFGMHSLLTRRVICLAIIDPSGEHLVVS